jgi:hypothetical protein
MVAAELHGTIGAGLLTVRTEETSTEVQKEAAGVPGDRVRRTGLDAGTAAVGAAGSVQDRQTSEAIWQKLPARGEWDRAVALPEAGGEDFQHGFISQVMTAVGQVEALVAEREVGDRLIA